MVTWALVGGNCTLCRTVGAGRGSGSSGVIAGKDISLVAVS